MRYHHIDSAMTEAPEAREKRQEHSRDHQRQQLRQRMAERHRQDVARCVREYAEMQRGGS